MFAESEKSRSKKQKTAPVNGGMNVRAGSAKDSAQHLLQVFHGMMPLAILISKSEYCNVLHAKYDMSFHGWVIWPIALLNSGPAEFV